MATPPVGEPPRPGLPLPQDAGFRRYPGHAPRKNSAAKHVPASVAEAEPPRPNLPLPQDASFRRYPGHPSRNNAALLAASSVMSGKTDLEDNSSSRKNSTGSSNQHSGPAGTPPLLGNTTAAPSMPGTIDHKPLSRLNTPDQKPPSRGDQKPPSRGDQKPPSRGDAAPPALPSAIVAEPGDDEDDIMYKETARLITKRQTMFKTRYEAEAKLKSRNKALVQLVKSLAHANMVQHDQIRMLKGRVGTLEKQVDKYKPLEALLEFMVGAEDDRLLALLAPGRDGVDGEQPVDAAEDAEERQPQAPETVVRNLMQLMQVSADWAHEEMDSGLQEDAYVIGTVLRGEGTWHEHAEAVAEAEAAGERQQGGEGASPRRRGRRAGEGERDAGDFDIGDDDSEDPFAAEMLAVGTELHVVCGLCGEEYIESQNGPASCRHHPGLKRVDASWNSVWSCCGLKAGARGCIVGAHVPQLDGDQEAEDDEEESQGGEGGMP